MSSIEVDTVLRGLNNSNRVQDYARQHEGVWAKLLLGGASGGNVEAYGKAIRELQGLNETARLDRSAAGQSLSPGETMDLQASIAKVEDLGTRALRDQMSGGDLVCRAPSGEATRTDGATPAAQTERDSTRSTGDKKTSGSSEPNTSGTYRSTPTTLAQVAKGEGVLRDGDQGAAVGEAQSLLRQITTTGGKPKYDLGAYGDKGDGVDGKLGPKTKAAIEQFKKDQGLKSDGSGTIDKDTLARMQAVAGASSLDQAYAPTGRSGANGKPGAGQASNQGEAVARTERSTAADATAGAAVGLRAAGREVGSVREVKAGPRNALVVPGSNANAGRTFEVPTRGQEIVGRGMRAAGVVGMAYGAVQDAKSLGEAAGADTVRGDGKHTEVIKEGAKVAGHWAGAAVGAKAAVAVTTPFALAAGPAAPIVIGAAGVIGGIGGYFLGDWAGAKAGNALSQ